MKNFFKVIAQTTAISAGAMLGTFGTLALVGVAIDLYEKAFKKDTIESEEDEETET